MTTSSSLSQPDPRSHRDPFAARGQRRRWDRRAASWDTNGSSGLAAVVDAVLRNAAAQPGSTAVDLGSGTGQLTLPLADAGVTVTAVDVSPEMLSRLREKISVAGIDATRVTTVEAAIEDLSLPHGTVDLVVSNYALHHLSNDAKAATMMAAASWLRPGGRLVIGDMMFSRGATARDRRIIRGKLGVLARRGPAGWWRIAKNIVRFGVGISERPAPVEAWTCWLQAAGLVDVQTEPVVAEAVVMVATKPGVQG